MGLKGEAITDDKVWIVKSHHPSRTPMQRAHVSNKTIFCVRHPLDVLPSYANLLSTMNHATKVEYDMVNEYPEWWDWWVRRSTDEMKRFFGTLLKQTQE